MWMSVLKNNPDFKLYYSDTDSAVVDKQLPDYMVGTGLGQFKLEYTIKKAVEKLGYKITLIKGYEFTKADLFSNFVHTFYEIKRTSSGAEKMIAKLLLNNLYGYFGRKPL